MSNKDKFKRGIGLEKALASALLLGAFSGEDVAKAHDTNWPVFYFDVLDSNFNHATQIQAGSKFYVDFKINGTNSLGNISSNRVHDTSTTINFSSTNGLHLTQAILMTNGFWQGKPFSLKAVSNKFDNSNNLLADISLSGLLTNAVYGNGTSVRYVFNTDYIPTNQYFTLNWRYGMAENANGESHYIGGYPDYPNAIGENSGFWIIAVPEPSTGVLAGAGLGALGVGAGRRYRMRRRVERKVQEISEEIYQSGMRKRN